MNITTQQGRRAMEISQEMSDLLDEFKKLARETMSSVEYEQFKYNTLGHLEPGLNTDSDWFTKYSSIKPLQRVAEDMEDESGINDEDEFEDEED